MVLKLVFLSWSCFILMVALLFSTNVFVILPLECIIFLILVFQISFSSAYFRCLPHFFCIVFLFNLSSSVITPTCLYYCYWLLLLILGQTNLHMFYILFSRSLTAFVLLFWVSFSTWVLFSTDSYFSCFWKHVDCFLCYSLCHVN